MDSSSQQDHHLHDHDPDCPFCNIAAAFPPTPATSSSTSTATPLDAQQLQQNSAVDRDQSWNPDRTFPPSFVVLSTPHVIAFFDIAPLTRGHILVAPRRHRVKIGDLRTGEGAEIGKWLPILSRAVVKSVLGVDHTEGDWNVVQNNGSRAAQVIPHMHFHIVPRPASGSVPSLKQVSWTMFARGQRSELDEDDAAALAGAIRSEIGREVEMVRRREGVDLFDHGGGWRTEGKGRL